MSLRSKYLLQFSFLLTALSVVLMGTLAHYQRRMVFQALGEKSLIVANNLAGASILALKENRSEQLLRLVAKAKENSTVEYVALMKPNGQVIVEYPGNSPLKKFADGGRSSWPTNAIVEAVQERVLRGPLLYRSVVPVRLLELPPELLALGQTEGLPQMNPEALGFVVLLVSTEQAWREILQALLWGGALTLFVLLLSGVVIFVATNSAILRPLTSLADVMGKVGEGDLNRRIESKQMKGEFKILADTFNGMIGNLMSFHKRLSEMNRTLEDRVSQRTKELAKIANDLKTANGQLKELDEAKSKFVSLVSHEFRAPLAAIKGFSSMLLKMQMPADKQQTALTVIDQQVDRLARMVEDLLDLSRIQNKRVEFRWSRVNIAEVASMVAQVQGARFPNLKIQVAANGGIEAVADKDKVEQIIMNYVSNAAKYSPEDGVVTIVGLDHGQEIEVQVNDRGPGIPPEKQGMIFKEFFRAGDSVTQKFTGTGLGLPITKALVEAMGGRVWFESAVGKGTSFRFSIPKKREGVPLSA